MEPPNTNQPPQAQTPHNEVHTGKSRDPLKMWAVVLVVLLLAVIGLAAWQAVRLNVLDSKVSSLEKTAADLQSTKTTLQTELDSLMGVDTSGNEYDPDTIKVLAAVDAFARAAADATGDFEYSITKNDGKFAKVNVSVPEGGDYVAWVKKVDDNWTVVLSGQDAPAQTDLEKYEIPADF